MELKVLNMSLLRIANLSKKYKLENEKERVVLNNISLTFPNKGLMAILGKSGSGKSTLLNMISLMDEPTNGCVYFHNKNIQKFDLKEKENYRNKNIGIVFQHYHLLENETVLFNIMLPLLMRGEKQKNAEIAAKNLLKTIDFKENLYKSKCQDLSGGEKERVAILRSLINNPEIILADEPTGALDSKNSNIVMELLKQISKERLVIVVSHNEQLINKYADRIIHVKDGQIEEQKIVEEDTKIVSKVKPKKEIKQSHWIRALSRSNFVRRIKRNIIAMTSLFIGLTASLLIVGFSNGSSSSIRERTFKQIDYGVSTISKETSQQIPGSKMTLVQMSRPTNEELINSKDYLTRFHIEPNISSLISKYPIIKSGDSRLDELSYNPIYSFIDDSLNKDLLIRGNLPSEETFDEVLINKSGYDYIKKEFKSDPIGLILNLHSEYEHHFYSDNGQAITDYFVFDKEITIVGMVDDLSFLATPKLYYSYQIAKEYLQETFLVNLSAKENRDITWYDMLLECDGSDSLSSYSYQLFLKDYHDNSSLNDLIKEIPEPLKIDSPSITVSNALFDLISAATLGMELFLIIALVGTTLILGIISFSSYTEDKKTSAILTCLGANKKEIFSIYFYENLFICLISLISSFVLSPLLALLTNIIIQNITGFMNMISIPLLAFLIIIPSTLLICAGSTYLPLFFSKKISPKEELAEE